MKHTRKRAPCFLAAATLLHASANPPVATRAAQIEAKRAEKAAHLTPERLPALHRGFLYVEENRLYYRITSPTPEVSIRFDAPGGGFAAGPQYLRRGLLGGRAEVRTSVVGTTQAFYLADAAFAFPNLAGGRVSLEFLALRQWSPYLSYYGPGPGSQKSGRTAYSFENTGFEVRSGYNLTRNISTGGLTRYLLFNVGPGRKDEFASTDEVFTPATTPGLDQQTNFINPGVFLDFNWVRYPRGRRSGTRLLTEYTVFFDSGAAGFTFGRFDVDVRRYFALLNGQREVLLRARAAFADPFGSEGVPFYVQPRLGGAESLRGFRNRRFYDNNMFVLNGEYRWEIADQTDAALFVDAGKVFPSLGQIRPFQDLSTSYGFGVRIRQGNVVSWRFDVGFSSEGPQVWLTFGDLF